MFSYVSWLGAWVFIYTSIVRVAECNSSAQLANDSHNTHHVLYPGSVKALLHSATYTDVAQFYRCWGFYMCLIMMSYV